jgi:predicted ATPase
VQQARRVRPDFELQPGDLTKLLQICHLTAGMPLALELAAGWLDTLSLDHIAAEIQRGIDIFETEIRDVPERHRSIRATFELTWQRAPGRS